MSLVSVFFHQEQQESHSQTVSSLTDELSATRKKLREREKGKKEADIAWQNIREERQREEGKLRDSLEKRDKLIEVGCRNLLLILSSVLTKRF